MIRIWCISNKVVKGVCLLFIVGLLSTTALGGESYYDRQGTYQGKKSDSGQFYDRKGVYQGKKTSSGKLYDRKGVYQGKVTKSGKTYNRRGEHISR